MEDNFLKVLNQNRKQEIKNIKEYNEYTSKYGLTLTDEQIKDIIIKKENVLNDMQRVEIGFGTIDKIIREFCDSPYITNDNYCETISELIEIFYNYKNETADLITDDDLIKTMKQYFDDVCQGSLEYLSDTILYKFRENLLKSQKQIKFKKENDDE